MMTFFYWKMCSHLLNETAQCIARHWAVKVFVVMKVEREEACNRRFCRVNYESIVYRLRGIGRFGL